MSDDDGSSKIQEEENDTSKNKKIIRRAREVGGGESSFSNITILCTASHGHKYFHGNNNNMYYIYSLFPFFILSFFLSYSTFTTDKLLFLFLKLKSLLGLSLFTCDFEKATSDIWVACLSVAEHENLKTI